MKQDWYICDICKKRYDFRDDIQFTVWIGHVLIPSNLYHEVCEVCVDKINNYIEKNLLVGKKIKTADKESEANPQTQEVFTNRI